jgi:subtilisin family serine protease
VGALASAFAVAAPAWAQTDATALMQQKVEPDLLTEIHTEGEAELWVQFHGSPDYSAAHAAESKADKGAAAVAAAMEFAETSQADLTTALEEAGVEYESYWASSAIKVTGGTDLLETITAFDDVAAVVDAPRVEPVEPVESAESDLAAASAGWGVTDINAPTVWDQLGVTGEGVVVASIDSGVQYDHPALVAQYRGNNGDGTFTHDYNFYDVEGSCGAAPCDLSNHGTHTVGTMVGDDGAGNQIGVAPGAEWIAANYYGSSMESVLKAGQWIVAPTDWQGNNPDPSKAPDIVNNSWGRDGDDDPYYEDIVDLWHAAGIIPVFAAGNSGPVCTTTNAPGGYPNVIAVGAYDLSGAIADFSSRGPTSDGRVKPDVSAPGSGIHSSVPGSGYGSQSGTSMAAPHVAGTIALMMSAEPALRGDYDLVYEMLTGSARYTEDDQCGGTAEANNVHGYGRIDALAAAQALPEGDHGSISGTVTDPSGAPLEGAELVFDGAFDRRTTTEADGTYTVKFALAGQHAVTVEKFGYQTATGTVTVAAGQTAVFNAALTALPTTVVTGSVVDGHGWPLAATVSSAGGEVETRTDPLTGEFELTLPTGGAELVVEADYAGYQTVHVDVTSGNVLIEVPVASSCTAPGYAFDPLGTGFESETTPVGWTVLNRGPEPWTFDDRFNYGNLTPGTGGFAFARPPGGGTMDTDLISPVFDLSSADEPVLTFATDFYGLLPYSQAEVTISVDGGQTWQPAWTATDSVRDSTVTVDLSAWATAQNAQLKFHYYHAYRSGYWWQIDDVLVGGTPDCVPLPGGLVRGTVTDQSGAPVAGAVVTHTASGHHGISDADGHYWTFAPGSGQFTAVDAESGSATGSVVVIPDDVTEADFVLAS